MGMVGDWEALLASRKKKTATGDATAVEFDRAAAAAAAQSVSLPVSQVLGLRRGKEGSHGSGHL